MKILFDQIAVCIWKYFFFIYQCKFVMWRSLTILTSFSFNMQKDTSWGGLKTSTTWPINITNFNITNNKNCSWNFNCRLFIMEEFLNIVEELSSTEVANDRDIF